MPQEDRLAETLQRVLPRDVTFLFDLDGTLVDSAPDLAAAINRVRAAHGLPSLPYEQLRPAVGTGARGMVGIAFGLTPQDEGFEALRDEFLATYELALCERTVVFADVDRLLDALEDAQRSWGIVTNKAERFALPLCESLGLTRRAATLICGDTTPHAKPHPAPLQEAARRLGVRADRCVYVGDDLRDVQAGRAAGMRTLVAGWGYLGFGDHPDEWGADATLASTLPLLQWLDLP